MERDLRASGACVILLVLFATLFFLPATVSAAVGDVTLTGVPPNTTVSFINEQTGEKVEAKTAERDDKGVVVIPFGEKKWEAGIYTVAVKEPTGRIVSQPVPLRDGSNEINLGVILGATGKQTSSKETEKVEEQKPSFWDFLAPSFGIGIGIGGGRERGERGHPNPCLGK